MFENLTLRSLFAVSACASDFEFVCPLDLATFGELASGLSPLAAFLFGGILN